MRVYVDKVFAAAGFLQYGATEEQLVGRIVMNLHPSVLAHTAFLDRPHTWKELISAVGLIEEKFSIMREHQKTLPELGPLSGNNPRPRDTVRNLPRENWPRKCWNCGQMGHMSRDCCRPVSQSGNMPEPGGH